MDVDSSFTFAHFIMICRERISVGNFKVCHHVVVWAWNGVGTGVQWRVNMRLEIVKPSDEGLTRVWSTKTCFSGCEAELDRQQRTPALNCLLSTSRNFPRKIFLVSTKVLSKLRPFPPLPYRNQSESRPWERATQWSRLQSPPGTSRIPYSSGIVHLVPVARSVLLLAFMLRLGRRRGNWKWNFYDSSYLMISFITAKPRRRAGELLTRFLLWIYYAHFRIILHQVSIWSSLSLLGVCLCRRPLQSLENFMFITANKLWHVLPRASFLSFQ